MEKTLAYIRGAETWEQEVARIVVVVEKYRKYSSSYDAAVKAALYGSFQAGLMQALAQGGDDD